MRKASPIFKALRAGYIASMLLGVLLLVLSSIAVPADARSTGGVSARSTPTPHPPMQVDVASFKLPITPVTAEYYNRLITTAENDGAAALVIQLDTPGGLVDSMLTMVKRTLAANVPVIVYVSPQGAMATSAGVFVVYSSHVAAMAPNSTIGSS